MLKVHVYLLSGIEVGVTKRITHFFMTLAGHYSKIRKMPRREPYTCQFSATQVPPDVNISAIQPRSLKMSTLIPMSSEMVQSWGKARGTRRRKQSFFNFGLFVTSYSNNKNRIDYIK